MKKTLFILVILFIAVSTEAQVCNSGHLLKPGRFSIGLVPYITTHGSHNDLAIHLSGGWGLTRSIDLSINSRLAGNDPYFGADLEWALIKGKPALSLTTGAHIRQQVGLDATFNFAFPVVKPAVIYTGIDMDINFDDNGDNVGLPVWFFVGAEIRIRRNVALVLEFDLGISGYAHDLLALGFSFYI